MGEAKLTLRVWLTIWRERFKDWRRGEIIDPPAVPSRRKGQHISWLTYKEVKHSLKLVGMARGYEDVAAVARMHNIGRTTAYEIKNAASYGDFTGRAKRIEIKSSSRAYKVPVYTK